MSDKIVRFNPERINAEREAASRELRESLKGGGPVEPPPGGPHDPGMEARVARLEEAVPRLETRMDARFDSLDGRLRAIEQAVAGMTATLDILTNKVMSKLPSWWQMPAVIGSTVAVLGALYAGMKFLLAHGLL